MLRGVMQPRTHSFMACSTQQQVCALCVKISNTRHMRAGAGAGTGAGIQRCIVHNDKGGHLPFVDTVGLFLPCTPLHAPTRPSI